MPKKTSVLRSPAVQNLVAAGTAGVVTLLRPARFPRWARRSLGLANSAGTAGSVFLAARDGSAAGGPFGLTPTKGVAPTTASAGSALAAAAGGLGLITSGLGIRADQKVEQLLLQRGVRRPRIWMAVGVVGVVFLLKTAQDLATRRAETSAAKLVNRSTGTSAAPAVKPTVNPAPAIALSTDGGPTGRTPADEAEA